MADAVIEAEYHNFIHHINVLKRYECNTSREQTYSRILLSFWWRQVVDVVIEAQ